MVDQKQPPHRGLKTQYFRVRNFEKFQHYKDRNPSWIKVYSNLLNDMNFTSMTDSQQINLVKIWLLASQNKNHLVFNSRLIGRQLGANSRISLQYFVDNKWLEIIGVTPKTDSKMVAPNKDKEYKEDTKEKDLKKRTVKKKKAPPQKPKQTNPEIKIAIDHFHNEYLQRYSFKPDISGAHGRIFEGQLKKRPILELKKLITLYLDDRDNFLVEKAHPVELFLNRINALKMKMKKYDAYQNGVDKEIERQKAQEENRITLPELNGAPGFWAGCLDEIATNILPESFDKYIKPIKYLGMNGKDLYLEVPSQYFKDAILNHFHKFIVGSNPEILTIALLLPEEYHDIFSSIGGV